MTESKPTLIHEIIEALQDKRGRKITTIDLSALHVANALNYVICSGGSTTQVTALADNVREHVQKQLGEKPVNYDGYRNATWIVIDFGETMVHVFVPEAREFYAIEQLWSDGVITEIPDID